MNVRISDYALALPHLRVRREQLREWGIPTSGSWSASYLADRDGDSLTLALAAARQLDHADAGSLALASRSLPYARRVQAAILVEALPLHGAFVSEHTTSSRASTEALSLHSWRVAVTGEDAIVLAAEHGPSSHTELGTASAGAAAVRIGPAGDVATITGMASASAEYPGLDYALAMDAEVQDIEVADYAQRAYQHVLTEALSALGTQLGDFASIVVAGAEPRVAERALRAAGGNPQQWRPIAARLDVHRMGAAGALAGLAAALDGAADGDRILLTSYGAGSTLDLIALEAGSGAGAGRVERAIAATRDVANVGELLTTTEVV